MCQRCRKRKPFLPHEVADEDACTARNTLAQCTRTCPAECTQKIYNRYQVIGKSIACRQALQTSRTAAAIMACQHHRRQPGDNEQLSLLLAEVAPKRPTWQLDCNIQPHPAFRPSSRKLKATGINVTKIIARPCRLSSADGTQNGPGTLAPIHTRQSARVSNSEALQSRQM